MWISSFSASESFACEDSERDRNFEVETYWGKNWKAQIKVKRISQEITHRLRPLPRIIPLLTTPLLALFRTTSKDFTVFCEAPVARSIRWLL